MTLTCGAAIRVLSLVSAVGFSVLGLSTGCAAADLVIGIKETHLGPDPHFSTAPTNSQINSTIFEPLVKFDSELNFQPHLALSWEATGQNTWIFRLRKDVKFSDGSPFTAHDVVFSYDRGANLPNAANSIKNFLLQVDKAEAIDDYTVKITTVEPSPTLPNYLANVYIASKKNGEGKSTDDFNTGKATIGTGPYKFVSWTLNDKTVLERNPDYWGEKEPWDKVIYRSMANDASRVAALLSGDLDVASIPAANIEQISANPALVLSSRESTRIAYLTIDGSQEALDTGRVTGPNGEKLDKNPLGDIRVRKAMKMAIDLNALVTRIYGGQAVATGQLVSSTLKGYNPKIPAWKADVEGARKLMAETGFANKFKLTIAFGTDFYQGAQQASEAIAQMWTRIGVPTQVVGMPYAVFLRERQDLNLPISTSTGTNTIGAVDRIFTSIALTRRPKQGLGPNNYNRYSNPELDKVVEEGLQSMDQEKHDKLFEKAAEIVDDDAMIVPLWMLPSTVATKKTLQFHARLDGMILPRDIRPAKTP